jgi:hypothetical protein
MDILRVHFLYGSRPSRLHRHTEKKWFGGILGGHVGLQLNEEPVLHFMHVGKFHLFPRRSHLHAAFRLNNTDDFYRFHGGAPSEVKKLAIDIPVSPKQKEEFLKIREAYLRKPPYDYAFLGMRCASAAYEILAQLGIAKQHGSAIIAIRIFYPRILRRYLLKNASTNGWNLARTSGTTRRKWDKD